MTDEEICAVGEVLRSGMLVHGTECAAFEERLANYIGVRHAVLVSSGTAALHVALMALDIGPGDAVIVPDFTFPATANVVELVGARPVLVDVGPSTYSITPDCIETALSRWSGNVTIRAIMPVHQFGCPADMTGIMEVAERNNLLVIEDAACALGGSHRGRTIGTFGNLTCFSFHPRKTITTGEGGLITTDDDLLASKLRQIRNHGIEYCDGQMDIVRAGLNYRMTDIQAAVGKAQLARLDGYIRKRRSLRQTYESLLRGSKLQLPALVDGHTWQTFMVILPDDMQRETVIRALREKGIESNLGAYAIHSLSYYRQRYADDCERFTYDSSDRLYRQGLALPLHPDLTVSQVQNIASALLEVFQEARI